MEISYVNDTLPIGELENQTVNTINTLDDNSLFFENVIDLQNIDELNLDDLILEIPKTIVKDNKICELRISYHDEDWECYYADKTCEIDKYFISKSESIHECLQQLYDNIIKIYEND